MLRPVLRAQVTVSGRVNTRNIAILHLLISPHHYGVAPGQNPRVLAHRVFKLTTPTNRVVQVSKSPCGLRLLTVEFFSFCRWSGFNDYRLNPHART